MCIRDRSTDAELNSFEIQLLDNQNVKKYSAQLVRGINEIGGDVYSIQQSQKALESLFREVNEAPVATNREEISHAA